MAKQKYFQIPEVDQSNISKTENRKQKTLSKNDNKMPSSQKLLKILLFASSLNCLIVVTYAQYPAIECEAGYGAMFDYLITADGDVNRQCSTILTETTCLEAFKFNPHNNWAGDADGIDSDDYSSFPYINPKDGKTPWGKNTFNPLVVMTSNNMVRGCVAERGGYYHNSHAGYAMSYTDDCSSAEPCICGPKKCGKCPRGKFSEGGTDPICKSCISGKYNLETGQSACKLCPKGKYAPLNGTGGHVSRYNRLEGRQSCIDCRYTTNKEEGANWCGRECELDTTPDCKPYGEEEPQQKLGSATGLSHSIFVMTICAVISILSIF